MKMARRILSILLLGVVLLTGCQPADDRDKGGDTLVGGAYTRRYVEITAPSEQMIMNAPQLIDDHTVLQVGSELAADDSMPYRFYLTDLLTGKHTELYSGVWSYERDLQSYAVDVKNGILWAVSFQMGDAMFGGTQSDHHTLQALDMATGESLWELNLNEETGQTLQSVTLSVAEGKGSYVLARYDDGEESGYLLMLCDAAAKKVVAQTGYPKAVNWSFLRLGDGRVAILSEKDNSVQPIAAGTCQTGEPLLLGENITPALFANGGEAGLFLYADADRLYRHNTNTGAGEPVLQWPQWGVILGGQVFSQPVDMGVYNGTVVCLVKNLSTYGAYLLTPCEETEAAPELTVAGHLVGEAVQRAAVAFNQTRFDYTARIVDYAQYDESLQEQMASDEEFPITAGITKLNTELLAGRELDLLCLDGKVSSAALIRQGALLDLYPLLDADKELGREDFVPAILAAAERDGHLYQLATHFSLETLVSSKAVAGELARLDRDTLGTLQAAHPDTPLFAPSYIRTHFMRYLTHMTFTDYIDADRKTCHFDSEAFVDHLEISGGLLSAKEFTGGVTSGALASENNAALAGGTYLLAPESISGFTFYQRLLSDLKGEAQFVGHPTGNGVGHILTFSNTLGILASSKKQAAAWDFVKISLSLAQADAESGVSGVTDFTTIRASFEQKLAYFQDEDNFIFATTHEGNPALPLTDEDVTQLYQMIADAKPAAEFDARIYEIIAAEASYYYAGQCIAEEAAQKIQSRVSLYLNEQN